MRDKGVLAVSLVGYLLIVATLIAVVAAIVASG
jgi:hypothetical protein